MDVRRSNGYCLGIMKNLVRIVITLSLLVFTSSAVLRVGDMAVAMTGNMTGVAASFDIASVAPDTLDPRHDIQNEKGMRAASECTDCSNMSGAIASCHFLCAIVVMPDMAGMDAIALPASTRLVLPARDRATGLSHVPDPSPPRYLS